MKRIQRAAEIDGDDPARDVAVFECPIGPGSVKHAGIGDQQVYRVRPIKIRQKLFESRAFPQVEPSEHHGGPGLPVPRPQFAISLDCRGRSDRA